MGVILRDTKKAGVAAESRPPVASSSRSASRPEGRWTGGRRTRLALVTASAVVSLAVAVALALAAMQVTQPQTAPTRITYATRPVAIINGHVLLQGASGWKDVTPTPFGHTDPVDAQFLSPTLGWTVDVEVSATSTNDVVVYRTSDGGGAWKSVTLPWQDEGLANLVQLQFLDAQHGYFMVGLGEATSRRPGFLFATADGGVTWTKLTVPYGGGIRFTTPTDGWLVGGGVNYSRNQFSVTHDGGRSWQDQPLAAPAGLELLDRHIGTPAFISTHDGVTAANFGTEVAFYTSSDDGATWLVGSTFPVAQADRETLPIVAMLGKDGLASVGAALYATHDGGATWSAVHRSGALAAMLSADRSTAFVAQLAFARASIFNATATTVQWLGVTSGATGWAVVSHGGFCQAQYLSRCNNETLLMTSDGGATWSAAA